MDTFSSHSQSLNAPIRSGAPVTPSNSADLPVLPRALYIGGGGDISMILAGGETITLKSVPAGAMLPLRASRVRQTGTTATALVALW
ncbi:MAG: hypothetical protein Q4P24_16650 [Rhodobacterales bacterium]|nr:hypothetical protein [Rhodobacterales bacterium]